MKKRKQKVANRMKRKVYAARFKKGRAPKFAKAAGVESDGMASPDRRVGNGIVKVGAAVFGVGYVANTATSQGGKVDALVHVTVDGVRHYFRGKPVEVSEWRRVAGRLVRFNGEVIGHDINPKLDTARLEPVHDNAPDAVMFMGEDAPADAHMPTVVLRDMQWSDDLDGGWDD